MVTEADLIEAASLVALEGAPVGTVWMHPYDFVEFQPILAAHKQLMRRLFRRTGYPGGRKYRSAVRRLRAFGVTVEAPHA